MGANFNTFKKTFLLFVSPHIFKSSSARIRCFFAVLLILVDVSVASLVPYYSKYIVDSLSLNILNNVWIAVAFLGLFWILEKTVTHIQDIIFFPAINLTIRNLTYNIVNHIHHIALPDYKKLSIPEVINCIRRISFSARSFIKILFLMIIPTIFKLAIAVIITIKTGLFGIALLPALFLTMVMLYKGTQWYVNARESAWQVTDQVTMRINDSLLNTKIVRAVERFEMDQLGDLLNREADLWYKTNTRLHMMHVLIGTLLGLTMMGILACTIVAIQQKTLTIGDFVLLKGLLIAAFLPLRTFSLEYRQLAESLVDIKKIIQIFEIPIEEKREISLTAPQNVSNGIFLKNIYFSHENHPMIFNNLTLYIPKGEKTAIIGESGCGKSALINLIASLYKPTKGSIYIEAHQKICCIPQDFRLFNISLRDNITYGIDHVSESALIKAVNSVELIEMVEKMPHGFDTIVGEMGTKLSGGEKQKIALARALLLRPDILLLDETTSALNFESEKIILEVLFSSIPTIIMASHRTSTLPYMDRVLKIEKGRLVEIKVSSPEKVHVPAF